MEFSIGGGGGGGGDTIMCLDHIGAVGTYAHALSMQCCGGSKAYCLPVSEKLHFG